MPSSAPRPPLPALTSLRFFAAAEVVVYHGSIANRFESGFLRDLSSGGYEAVTFFFVLSGFILTYVYSGASAQAPLTVSVREFWKARIARILPGYACGLLIALPHFAFATFVSKLVTVPFFLVAVLLVPLLLQAWWPPHAMAWNAVAWSLSVEMFFYASFPALLHALRRVSNLALVLIVYGLIVATAAVRQALTWPNAAFDTFEFNFSHFFPLFHLPQFIFGMVLGRIFLFGPVFAARTHGVVFTAGAAALFAMFGMRSSLPAALFEAPVLAPLFGAVIFGAARLSAATRPLTGTAIICLGEASYAMYIIHMPLARWWNWLTRGFELPWLLGSTAYFIVLVGLSVVILNYIERPLRRRILGHREHRDA